MSAFLETATQTNLADVAGGWWLDEAGSLLGKQRLGYWIEFSVGSTQHTLLLVPA